MVIFRIVLGFVLLYVNYILISAGIKAGEFAVFLGFFAALVFDIITAPFWISLVRSKNGTSNNTSKDKRDTKEKGNKPANPPVSQPRTIRCPNCGAQATVRGNQWECGWCGNYGRLR